MSSVSPTSPSPPVNNNATTREVQIEKSVLALAKKIVEKVKQTAAGNGSCSVVIESNDDDAVALLRAGVFFSDGMKRVGTFLNDHGWKIDGEGTLGYEMRSMPSDYVSNTWTFKVFPKEPKK